MKRRLLLVVATLLILIGIFIFVKVVVAVLAPKGHGGLQITSNVDAEIFLNNKSVGKTPLCLCDQGKTIKSGDYNIKIAPRDSSLQPFNTRVIVNPNVLTAVDRVFLPGALSSAYIITLERTSEREAQVFIASVPDEALIAIDGESEGVTPLNIKSISTSEHEVEIEKQGFAKKTVRIRAVPFYKLVLNTILGTEGSAETTTTPVPQTAISSSPTASQTKVLISQTPTGFLRVRAEPSVSSAEVGRVSPGESYLYVDENDAWYEIALASGTRGWVSKTYSQKQTAAR